MKPLWIIRCDATRFVGLGHLSRCLAVAEGLQDEGGRVNFVGCIDDDAAVLLKQSGFKLTPQQVAVGTKDDAEHLASVALKEKAAGIVCDGYHFQAEWIRHLHERAFSPVLLDDFGTRGDYSCCKGIINFTVGAPDISYQPFQSSQLLLGPPFFTARRALRALRVEKISQGMGPVNNLLICLGGTATRSILQSLLDILADIAPSVHIRLLAPSFLTADLTPCNVRQVIFPICDSLVPHFRWADACISGGGLIKYECAYLGLPVGIISLNPDQYDETLLFARKGLGFHLDDEHESGGLAQHIQEFLDDHALRNRLTCNGRGTFSIDSTQGIAKRLFSWIK